MLRIGLISAATIAVTSIALSFSASATPSINAQDTKTQRCIPYTGTPMPGASWAAPKGSFELAMSSSKVPAKNVADAEAKVEVAEAEKKEEPAAEAKPAAAAGDLSMTPEEYVMKAEKGTLKNPYTGNAKAIEEGETLFIGNCAGCHGGGAGGGMCPPITNEVWIYGSDDDTLMRLVALGSKKLREAGYNRKRTERVKGDMMAFDGKNNDAVQNTDEMWKIIAWLRTKYKGRKKSIDW